MKEIIKLGAILFLISAVAAACLGFVNAVTKDPIAQASMAASVEARKALLPEATEFEQLEIQTPEDYATIREVYQGIADGEICGFTFKTAPQGYGGEVEVMVGINLNGAITSVSIGEQNETPGLGTKAKDVQFNGQYNGKSSELSVIKSGMPKDDEILAISGATITSRAVTSGVNEALAYYQNYLSEVQ